MALGIIVVVITLWILCTANSSSNSNSRRIYSSAAHNASFKVKVVDRDKQDLNEVTREWENGYFVVFDALVKRKIKNQGKLSDLRQSRRLISVSPSKGQVDEPPKGAVPQTLRYRQV